MAADAGLDPIRGQWGAQLASKYDGVIDPTQQNEPFTLSGILHEIQQLTANEDFGDLVRVVLQGDWGGTTPHEPPIWVTFADIDAPSQSKALQWCEDHFEARGTKLDNICHPREFARK